jgi:hypothetical protein
MTLGIAQGGLLTLTTEDAFYMQTAMRMTEKKKPKQTQQVPEAA